MLWGVNLWNEMERLRREMDSLISFFGRERETRGYPLVNVYDGVDNIFVTAELPGMARDKINITFADGVLTLSGKIEPLSEVQGMTVIRQERAAGEFEKTVRIPVKVIQDKISASFENGILTITLPKAEETKPKTIPIETK